MAHSSLGAVHGVQVGRGPQGLGPVLMPLRGGGSGVLWRLPCSAGRDLPHTALSLRQGLALGEPLAFRQPLLFFFLLGPVPPACLSPELALLQDQVGLVGLCWPVASGETRALGSCVPMLGTEGSLHRRSKLLPAPLGPLLVPGWAA